jgi:hypothetical protein
VPIESALLANVPPPLGLVAQGITADARADATLQNARLCLTDLTTTAAVTRYGIESRLQAAVTLASVSDVVRIELGVSILQGELIAREAEAAGLRVQLLRNEHPETGAAFALGTCALLVAGEHEREVRELLAEHGY